MASDIVTGWLLVGGTVIGLAFVAHPALLRIWGMPREQHVAEVASHRVVWAFLNAGFVLATVTTAAAIIILGGMVYAGSEWSSVILACGVAYAIGGVLWCAHLAIRSWTTPLLQDLGPDSYNEPPVRLLDAAMGGLFAAFVYTCAAALAVLGLALLLAGGLPAVTGILTMVVGVAALLWMLVARDIVPAVLYLPTLLIGVALLAGWE
jgi:hypothetical protein